MAKGDKNKHDLLVIGGSAGSLEVLIQLLPALQKDLDLSIVIILHRKAGESLLVELLQTKTSWPVKEAEEKEPIEKRTVYIAPSDYHLLIEKDKTFSIDYSEKIHFCRPSIDVSFETAADSYQTSVIGLLLSGANADGAEGLKQIHLNGGITIVQDPKEAAVAYMPDVAIQLLPVDYIGTTAEIIELINRLAGEDKH